MKALLFLLLFLLASVATVLAEVRYTAGSLRDPFAGQARAAVMEEEPSSVVEKKLQLLAIQGLVTSATNPRAIINGKIYRVGGEPLPGVKVTKIDKSGVYVNMGQKEILLNRKTQTTTKGKITNDPSKKHS